MITIKLKFFGVFKDYLNSEIDINLDDLSDLSSLKKFISDNLIITDINFLNDVLIRSVFSDGAVILSDNYILKQNDIIYLLPPFSGG